MNNSMESLLISKLLKENSLEIESLHRTIKGNLRKRLSKSSKKRIEALKSYSKYLEKRLNHIG